MKICNSEAMKLIKELEEKKKNVLYNENCRSRISYKEDEEKVLTKYVYAETREVIAEIDGKIRKIKHALAVCNCTAVVDDFGITIGEALVYLAQLNAEYTLPSRRRKRRTAGNWARHPWRRRENLSPRMPHRRRKPSRRRRSPARGPCKQISGICGKLPAPPCQAAGFCL